MSVIKFEQKEFQVVNSCEHDNLVIDRANKSITCKDCKTALDPFDAIMSYSDALDDWAKRLERYSEDTKREAAKNKIIERRLDGKRKTKCHHCNQVTEVRIKQPTLWEVHAEMATKEF